jgi:hypothetical protein
MPLSSLTPDLEIRTLPRSRFDISDLSRVLEYLHHLDPKTFELETHVYIIDVNGQRRDERLSRFLKYLRDDGFTRHYGAGVREIAILSPGLTLLLSDKRSTIAMRTVQHGELRNLVSDIEEYFRSRRVLVNRLALSRGLSLASIAALASVLGLTVSAAALIPSAVESDGPTALGIWVGLTIASLISVVGFASYLAGHMANFTLRVPRVRRERSRRGLSYALVAAAGAAIGSLLPYIVSRLP